MLHGDKKIVTLVHQTGNSNLVMHMHYMSKSISQGSGKYWELPSNTGKYREKLANTGKWETNGHTIMGGKHYGLVFEPKLTTLK